MVLGGEGRTAKAGGIDELQRHVGALAQRAGDDGSRWSRRRVHCSTRLLAFLGARLT
jgi:hypothetical protein